MTNDDRRHDESSRDRLFLIHQSYLRFSRRTAIALSVQAAFLILSLVVVGYALKGQRDTDKEVKSIAVRADFKSERNRVRQQLASEKVCSQSSDLRVACRALFDRLSGSISDQQRHELACAVLEQMRGPTARDILKATKCDEGGGP